MTSNNVIVADKRVVIIDFGKATMIKCPVQYDITPSSEDQATYNTNHRHLAHELRNVPLTRQSVMTDTYSVGYMFKHTACSIPYEPIIELGRQLKTVSVSCRLSLSTALGFLQDLHSNVN